MGGEAQKLRFHLEPGVPEPPRPEPPRVGMWGLVVHMVLMVPLIPTTILNAIVAVLTLPYLWRALNAPGHRVTTSMGTAPVSVVVLALAYPTTSVLGEDGDPEVHARSVPDTDGGSTGTLATA